MKKILAIVLCGAMLLTSCGSASGATGTTSSSSVKKRYEDMTVPEIPYDFEYGESAVTLSDVFVIEKYDNYEYSYYGYAKYDLSKLNDADYHWFYKDNLMWTPQFTTDIESDTPFHTKIHTVGNSVYCSVELYNGQRNQQTDFTHFDLLTTIASKDENDKSVFSPKTYYLDDPEIKKYEDLTDEERLAFESEDNLIEWRVDNSDRSDTIETEQ